MKKVLRPLGFHVSALVLGTLWFCVLVTAWATGIGLLITLLGLPVIWLTLVLAREMAEVEVQLARRLLDADVAAPPRLAGWRLWERLGDPRLWMAQGYLLLRFGLGLVIATVLIAVWGCALSLVAAPAYFWAVPDGVEVGLFNADTLWEAVAIVPVGVALGALAVPLTIWSGRGWKVLAEKLLPTGPVAGVARPLPFQVDGALRWTLIVCGALETLCVLIWALTGRTSPWPVWTALGLAVPIVALLAIKARELAPSPRHRGLYANGALALGALIICLGVWITAGGGYFWPVWVVVGWGVGLAVHALIDLGASSERRVLAPRVEQLTRSRAGVVDATDVELRRIERDLHDGAQARLVSVAMSLGLAEDRMDRDPEGARELVAEAQQQARVAIRELRDLARGIAPPVLADRGLQAAVEALAVTTPMTVSVQGDVGPRPPVAIERAAYFVTAEALTNAAKHSGAANVRVTLRRGPDELVVEVADDGRGGADPEGSGLQGLRQRVEAVDGTLEVRSPAGSGTIIRASLPCASS